MIVIEYALKLTGSVSTKQAFSLNGKIRQNSGIVLNGSVMCSTVSRSFPYPGPYVVTPNTNTQILYTKDRNMESNVTVNPIPPEYGLITWNGSFLKVS